MASPLPDRVCANPACGTVFTPRHARHLYCDRDCTDRAHRDARIARMVRFQASNVSYRSAHRALVKAGHNPSEAPWAPRLDALKGRGRVPGWREEVGLPPSGREGHKPRGPSRASSRVTSPSVEPTHYPAPQPTVGAPSTPRKGPVRPTRPEARTPSWEAAYAAAGLDPSDTEACEMGKLWRAACPAIGHLAPRGVTLAISAPVGPRTLRYLHAALSRIAARPHGTIPGWSLIALPTPQGRVPGQDWGVLWTDPADAERTRGRAFTLDLGPECRAAAFTFGSAVTTPRAPPAYPPGAYTVTVEAVTPVVHRTGGGGACERVTAKGVAQSLTVLAERLGLRYEGAFQPAVWTVEHRVEHVSVPVGGHFQASDRPGTARGWVGRVEVVCNAPAAWLLKTAESLGFGGMVALGMGRVRVTVAPVAEPPAPDLAETGVEVVPHAVERLRAHRPDLAGRDDGQLAALIRDSAEAARYLGWSRRAGLFYWPVGALDGVVLVVENGPRDGTPGCPVVVTVLPVRGSTSKAGKAAAARVEAYTAHTSGVPTTPGTYVAKYIAPVIGTATPAWLAGLRMIAAEYVL